MGAQGIGCRGWNFLGKRRTIPIRSRTAGGEHHDRTAGTGIRRMLSYLASGKRPANFFFMDLFAHPLVRRKADNDRQNRRPIACIHRNPQRHDLAADFRDWPFSSRHVYASNIEDGITTKSRFPSIPGGWELWKTSSRRANGLGIPHR